MTRDERNQLHVVGRVIIIICIHQWNIFSLLIRPNISQYIPQYFAVYCFNRKQLLLVKTKYKVNSSTKLEYRKAGG